VLRGSELHLRAVRLQEEHAQHARERGDEAMAREAEERAERARQRFLWSLEWEQEANRNGRPDSDDLGSSDLS
jgi:sRNA-binding protein